MFKREIKRLKLDQEIVSQRFHNFTKNSRNESFPTFGPLFARLCLCLLVCLIHRLFVYSVSLDSLLKLSQISHIEIPGSNHTLHAILSLSAGGDCRDLIWGNEGGLTNAMLNILLLVSDNKCLIPATVYSPSRSWFSYRAELPFPRAKAPPAKNDRQPWTQLEFALQIFRSSFSARGSWKFGFFLQTLPNALFTLQEILPNVSKTQTFAGGTNWREIRWLKSQKQQATSRYCLRSSSVCTMKTFMFYCYVWLCNWLKRFHMLWEVYLAKISRYLVN